MLLLLLHHIAYSWVKSVRPQYLELIEADITLARQVLPLDEKLGYHIVIVLPLLAFLVMRLARGFLYSLLRLEFN